MTIFRPSAGESPHNRPASLLKTMQRYEEKIDNAKSLTNINFVKKNENRFSFSRHREDDITTPTRPRGTPAPPRGGIAGQALHRKSAKPRTAIHHRSQKKSGFFWGGSARPTEPRRRRGREVRGTRATKKKHVRTTRFFQNREGFIEGEKERRYFLLLAFFASIGDF